MNDNLKVPLAGILAGSLAVTASYPFDILKTQQQIKNTNFVNTFSSLYGGSRGISKITNFYRGYSYILPQSASKTFIRFYTFDKTAELYKKYFLQNDEAQLNAYQTMLCGSSAGVVESLLVVQPTERSKVLRTEGFSPMNVYRNTLRTSGVGSLFSSVYKGFYPTLGRQIGNQATSFTVFYEAKKRLLENSDNTDLTDIQRLGLGFAGGVGGCVVTMPFDVTKSVAQAEVQNSGGILNTVKYIYNEGGIRSFFKGFGPRVFRVGLDRALLFFTYDRIMSFLNSY